MPKKDCSIYGSDENSFAESLARTSLTPSKAAFNAGDAEGRKPGKTSDPTHTDHSASEQAEPTVKVISDRGAGSKSRGN